MDMSTSYIKGATQHFPQASIVFDKFHVMVLAGKALEEVRLQLQREGAQLKGAMWSLRGNTWNLSPERQAQRQDLCRQYTQLGRAMSLRETLQAIYANSDRQLAEAELRWWCGWAARTASGLPPFGPDRSSVSGWHPRLLRYQAHLRSHQCRGTMIARYCGAILIKLEMRDGIFSFYIRSDETAIKAIALVETTRLGDLTGAISIPSNAWSIPSTGCEKIETLIGVSRRSRTHVREFLCVDFQRSLKARREKSSFGSRRV